MQVNKLVKLVINSISSVFNNGEIYKAERMVVHPVEVNSIQMKFNDFFSVSYLL